MKQFFIRGADKISYIDGEVGPNGSEDGMNWIGESLPVDQARHGHPPRRHADPRLHEAQRGRARRLHRDRQRRRHRDPEHAHLELRPLLDHLRERPDERIRRSQRARREQLLRLLPSVRRRVLLDRLRRRRWPGDDPLQLDDARNGLAERNRPGAERTDHRRLERHLHEQLGELLARHLALQRDPVRAARAATASRRRPASSAIRSISIWSRARRRSTPEIRAATRRRTSTGTPRPRGGRADAGADEAG